MKLKEPYLLCPICGKIVAEYEINYRGKVPHIDITVFRNSGHTLWTGGLLPMNLECPELSKED